MSKNSSISISFKIEDGADGLKTLTMDAKNLKTALESTVKAADNLKNRSLILQPLLPVFLLFKIRSPNCKLYCRA